MGSKLRSKMPEPGYSILKQKREFLCTELDARYLVGILYSFHIFDEDDKDRIEKAENFSKRDGVNKMLDILDYSGPSAYEKFIKALRESGYEIVADELEATTVQIPPDPCAWIDDLSAEIKTQPLKEKNLIILSNCIREGWESVMICLGNNDANIYQDKENYRSNVQMQIFASLNRWRQRKAKDATVIALLTAMRSCSSTQIDWGGVKECVIKL